MSSELQSLITLTVTGIGNCGVWDKKTGGNATAKPVLYRPGGMGPQIAYSALPIYEMVTLTRVFDNETRNDSALRAQLLPLAGRATVTVTEQPLDPQGNAFGPPLTATGILGSVEIGTADSESEAPRMWSVTAEITVEN